MNRCNLILTARLTIWNTEKRGLFKKLNNRFEHVTIDYGEKHNRAQDKTWANFRKTPLSTLLTKPFIILGKDIYSYFAAYFKIFVTPMKVNIEHGDCEILFEFNKKEVLDKWQLSKDSAYGLGKSTANVTLTKNNTALITGNLVTELNDTDKLKSQYSGYVSFRSLTQFKEFNVKKNFNLIGWTHILIKVKGDGRTYSLNFNTPNYFASSVADMYVYPLYTRGGPYWQYAKIPLSKFVSATHGRLSDKQFRFYGGMVSNIGFTLMDKLDGPFSLEIDYIGLVKDNTAVEEFSYEMYKVPNMFQMSNLIVLYCIKEHF